MRIGQLSGMEESYPRALAEVLEARGATMVPISLGGWRHDELPELDLVLDRISHEIPFFRSWLRCLCAAGIAVVNDPEVAASDDRILDAAVAERLGLRVPRTVVLPSKDHPDSVTPGSLRNLDWPVPFEDLLGWVGTPAEIRPVSVPGWRHATRIRDLGDLLNAYDGSGRSTLVLQEVVEGDAHFRAIVFGGREVIVAPYDPDFVRYGMPDDVKLGAAHEEEIVHRSAELAGTLGYELCAIEWTTQGEDLVVRNFVNAYPDFDRAVLGSFWFKRVVEATADLLLARASGQERGPITERRGGLRARLSTLGEKPPKASSAD